MVVYRLPENSELYHHGIMGQKWGVRRFQNKDGSLTSAGRKRRGLVEQIKYNRKMKKVRQAKVEKAKEQKRINDEKAERLKQAAAERRERAEVIKTGSAKDIQKFQDKMSDKEYEKALQRIQFTQSLDSYANAQAQAKRDKLAARLNTVMSTANTISSIAGSAANVYDSLSRMGVIKSQQSTPVKSAIDKMTEQRDKLNLSLEIAGLKDQKKLQKQKEELRRLSLEESKYGIQKNIAESKSGINKAEDQVSINNMTIKQLQDRIDELKKYK